MILDSLGNAALYYSLHPLFKQAFEYLKSVDFSKIEVGRIEIKGTDIFLMISDSDLKKEVSAELEVHNNYIDIQVPVSKSETFGWKARRELENAKGAFDTEKDIQFFEDSKTTLSTVVPGNFIVFFPEDAHAPCIGEGVIRKIVMKIKV